MPTDVVLRPIEEPWLTFLRAVDQALEQSTEIHCIGGFAVLLFLRAPRPTGDVDFIDTVPYHAANDLTRIAGKDSNLAARHKLYLQAVSITDAPCDYRTRLLDATPGGFEQLAIKVLDPYDLILTKVQRNAARDRQDAGSLISELRLERSILRGRFDEELAPYLAVAPETAAQHLDLWLEEFFS